MERVKGIEPSSQPWEGHILPLNHTRLRFGSPACTNRDKFYQTAARLATALPAQTGVSSLPMASRRLLAISFSRSGEVIFPSSTSLT